jgi:hypothetical protein
MGREAVQQVDVVDAGGGHVHLHGRFRRRGLGDAVKTSSDRTGDGYEP